MKGTGTVAVAKRIAGGYSIAGITTPAYVVSDLPKRCRVTNRPVIHHDEAHDLIERVADSAKKQIDLLQDNLRSSWVGSGITSIGW